MKSLILYIKHIGILLTVLLVFYLINPYQKNHYAGYLLVLLIYSKKHLYKYLDFDFTILLVFSLVYSLFSFLDPETYIQTSLIFGLFPPVFYLIGKYLVLKSKDEATVFYTFITVGFLYSLTALISVSFNLMGGGFIQLDRTIPLFWDGSPIKATLMGAYFTFNMCIPPLLLVGKIKIPWTVKMLLLAILLISLLCVFRVGSRTQLVIMLLSTALSVGLIFLRQSVIQNIKLVLTMLIVISLLLFLFPLDLNADYFSVLGRRLQESDNTGTAGGRVMRWTKSLDNLFIKPFGWELREFGYSHNLWLDIARSRGLLPFFILLVFSLRSLYIIKKAILININETYLSILFFSYMLAANLLFFVEPIMEGIFSSFMIYCLFYGGIKMYLYKYRSGNEQ